MRRRRQNGAALLLVLWVTVLLAALLMGVAAASRSHSEAALYGAQRVRAELAAEAGLAHAVAGLRAPTIAQQWVPDGRPYSFAFDGAKVTVAVIDVNGMVDLNAASPELLRSLFQVAGVDASGAAQMADTISAWRGGAPGANFGSRLLAGRLSAGRGAAQVRGPFRSIDQLARLPGMNAALYDRIERAVTVYSGRNFPDASYAGPLVLASLRGIDARQAETLVQQRRHSPAQRGAGNGQAFGAVANGPLVAGYGGVVERVFSVAEMPDGTRAGLDATLRLALTGGRARPYKVLDWRGDFTTSAP
ncbi:MAG: general secretion pathway protein GspK [Rhodanobacteraceae bacterium]|nr:MAG: general secretion pathway protein GspK [Rhodanobacteraceae bacterium]